MTRTRDSESQDTQESEAGGESSDSSAEQAKERETEIPESNDEGLVLEQDAARAREKKEMFAKANEQIRVSAERCEFDAPVPFLCECSEATCHEAVRLSLPSYRS